MVNQITTSTASTATAYSNQRKIDRCQNGVLWAVEYHDPGATARFGFYYSTDNGATWTIESAPFNIGNTLNYTPNASFFIDQDDYAHFVWKDRLDGFIYYRRGTPNAGRTAWTWSTALVLQNGTTAFDYPDIVAHREGSGWAAHAVLSYVSGTTNNAYCQRIDITSGGSISTPGATLLNTAYSASLHTYPSIDFNHTGDGKTVAGSTPHLYAAWSAGATGAGKGIRFKKATYSGGTWTWGTEREIDSGQHTPSLYWMNCLFDGTRVVMAGHVDGTVAGALAIYERDAADTTTTVRLRTAQATADRYFNGSATYDSAGNIYFTGQSVYSNSGTASLRTVKWDRNAGTVGTPSAIDTNVPDAATAPVHATLKRGYSNSRLEFIYTDGTASPYSVKYSYVGDPSPELYPASITTSTSATATAYSNQRKVDRTSNGVLWMVYAPPAVVSTDRILTSYSTDNGVTWTQGTPIVAVNDSSLHTPNASLFIDLDDYAHVAYKDKSNGFIYYVRGTPNAGRTAWTWSAAFTLYASATTYNYPDVVAHREGTGWKVHVVCAEGTNGNMNRWRLNVTSGGTITADENNILTGTGYAGAAASFPSIDFNHNGDGKTVAGSTPHLYAAWSAGATGAGKGIRFKKATYSGGTWTWGTEREIDTTRFINAATDESLQLLFDGVRVVIGSYEATNSELFLYERDAADTTTTIRFLASGTATSPAYYPAVLRPSISYDSEKNIYFVGHLYNTSYQHGYRKWVRGTNTLEPHVLMGSTTASRAHTSTKRGYSNNRIEFIYTDGNISPYTVNFGMIQLNRTPTVVNPTPAGAVGKGDNLTVNWTYSDLDSDPQAKYQIRWRKIL